MSIGNTVRNVALLLTFSAIAFAQEEPRDTIPEPAWFVGSVAQLDSAIEATLDAPELRDGFQGVAIRSLETGETIHERNADKLFMPASNLKLFTTASALLALGPDYRYRTELYASGEFDGAILRGDLIVKGYGDPTISGRFHEGDLDAIFESWADSLLELGVDEIVGNIVGDDNAFDDRGLGTGWQWDYESLWYAAPSGALSFNDNCVEILLEPTEVGAPPEMTVDPDVDYVVVKNRAATVPRDSATAVIVNRERGSNLVTVYGSVKESAKRLTTYATVTNPTQYFLVALKSVLERKGIAVTGYAIDADDLDAPIGYEDARLLFIHYSPTMAEIVKVVNKSSQNFYAEQLLKTLGFEFAGEGAAKAGVETMTARLAELGVSLDNAIIVDGSGLSRLNFVSPAHIIETLTQMYRADVFKQFYNSLPVAGVDGTMASRLKRSRANGNARAKTGYVLASRALSGYVHTGDGEIVAFALVANNYSAPYAMVDKVQDAIVDLLASFKRK
jgi:D-alanyl-D-alanine carboxypeptidase/D-alanyl-D-alanine-endopeptidase (penicillin-binding protein 4)